MSSQFNTFKKCGTLIMRVWLIKIKRRNFKTVEILVPLNLTR